MDQDFLELLEEEKKTRAEADLSIRRRFNSRYNTLNTRVDDLTSQQNNVFISGNESITGIKTFTQSPFVPNIELSDTNNSKAINKKYCDDKIAEIVKSAPETLNTLQELSNALGNDQNFATNISNQIGSKASIESPTFTGTPSATTAAAGTDTTQIATTAFVTNGLSLKANLASPTFTGISTFSGEILTNKQVEIYIHGTVSNSALSIDYIQQLPNIYAITPSSSSNISLTINNLPNNRRAIYNFTFLINTTTNKSIINSLSISGSSRTMIAIGGLSNISINQSATLVIQNIYIQIDNSTFRNAITNVSSCF